MKKLLVALALVVPTFLLTACGEMVEVPPAHMGKILGKNGYQPDVIPPSKFRLDACAAYCDKLVVIETADKGGREAFQLFMPRDQLNMKFDIRFTLAVDADDRNVNAILARVSPTADADQRYHNIVTVRQVYETYGKPVLREVVRSVVAQYSINEVASSREKVNAEIYEAVSSALAATPVRVKRIALADVQFPEVITRAKEAAADRRVKIEQKEADKQARMIQLQSDLEAAKASRAIAREKALAAKEENEIAAQSVTPEYLQYKTLDVLEKMAENGNAVFVPVSALDSLGLQQRIFQEAGK